MKNEILEALTIIEEEHNRTKKDIEIIKQAKQEIERLNNIIKEVREVINKGLNINSDYVDYDFGTELLRQELLEILDKGSNNVI